MDLNLTRFDFASTGIFGVLTDSTGKSVAQTLEHSYVGSNEPISYIPKLPPGVYICVRGRHKLAGMKFEFETFEITNVLGHSGILFHVGNFNEDSSGCVLLGKERVGGMITQSQLTFEAFMRLQAGCDFFALVVG